MRLMIVSRKTCISVIDLYTHMNHKESRATSNRLHCQDEVLSRAFQGNG